VRHEQAALPALTVLGVVIGITSIVRDDGE
jgi:hypothetical protein